MHLSSKKFRIWLEYPEIYGKEITVLVIFVQTYEDPEQVPNICLDFVRVDGTVMQMGYEQMSPGQRRVISQVAHLNDERRDQAMYLFAMEAPRHLTQFDIVKLHVVADVEYFLSTGKTIFGGQLRALPHGPVVSATLNAARKWAIGTAFFAATASCPNPLYASDIRVSNSGARIFDFKASVDFSADHDDFSIAEWRAMEKAASIVLDQFCAAKCWVTSRAFFHEPHMSAIGYAWSKARQREPNSERPLMDWYDVLDGAHQVEGRDVSYARAMLDLKTH